MRRIQERLNWYFQITKPHKRKAVEAIKALARIGIANHHAAASTFRGLLVSADSSLNAECRPGAVYGCMAVPLLLRHTRCA
jgi:hypothetical protein